MSQPFQKSKYRTILITCLLLVSATVASAMFFYISKNTANVAIIYMLAVVLVARYTDGYLPGIITSVVGVFCVNFIYTFPYMTFNFILDGYPVTFLGMFLVSGITSTTTTHLKEQNRIISEREKMLMEADKEKTRANLLRAISHDLRTPLTSIIGASGAYLDRGSSIDEEAKTSMVRNIYEDSIWLLHMVENLLSVTRIRDNKTNVIKSLEPLEEVVSEAVQRFHKRLKGITVHVSVPQDFIMIPMDATLIEQVIINLLENAVHHSKSNAPIDLEVSVHDRYAWFSVKDYGAGIPPERLNSIFDGYPISPKGKGGSWKGMGIGLSICKTIITAHNGEIYASNHNQGANFTFTLPLGDQKYE